MNWKTEEVSEEYLAGVKFTREESQEPISFKVEIPEEVDEESEEYKAFAKAVESWTDEDEDCKMLDEWEDSVFIKYFKNVQSEITHTVRSKNHDYSGDVSPFRNFELVEKLGITTTERGFLVRMCDKISRVSNLLDKEEMVSDEKVEDTLMDLAAYAMLMITRARMKNDEVPWV